MIKFNNQLDEDERFLTFTDAVKILGAGTGNRVRNFVRDGMVRAYRLPNVSGLRVRKSEILSLFEIKEPKND
jgi:hypothetical protein